jgi:RNA polymerase sigma-70 factor (ECF subfamily)
VNYQPYRNESTRSSILAGVTDTADGAAWARFFDTYAGYVFGIARHRGLAEADADEIVQQVMRELVHGRALRQYDRAKGPFHQWLAQLVAWRTSNWRRKDDARRAAEARNAARTTPPGEMPPEVETVCEAEWRATVLDEALRRLREESNPVHYAIFHASAVENLDTDAICRLHAVNADNLYQIRRRLAARLRVLLADAERDLDSGAAVPPPRREE